MASRRAKFLATLLWVLVLSTFAYLSFLNPWSVAAKALANLEAGPRIVIAISYQSALQPSLGRGHRTQTYLAFPDSFRTFNAYEVIQEGTGIRVKPISFGLFIFSGFYGLWIGASIWYVLRGDGKHGNAQNTP